MGKFSSITEETAGSLYFTARLHGNSNVSAFGNDNSQILSGSLGTSVILKHSKSLEHPDSSVGKKARVTYRTKIVWPLLILNLL